jgi:hypothetical protein
MDVELPHPTESSSSKAGLIAAFYAAPAAIQ